jgi:hypothetical protein
MLKKRNALRILAFAGLSAAAILLPSVVIAASAVNIDSDDIGGVVTSAKGAEAGVWVIAETHDLKTTFTKIVVTDDKGRYVLPDLPKAKYDVWVRGYGLVDSKPVKAAPGQSVDLTATVAPDARAAAEYYPSNYWYALLQPPAASEFPGTGAEGNGIAPAMQTQQQWMGHLKENCIYCHQLGDFATRTLQPTGSSMEAWAAWVQNGTGTNADPRLDKLMHNYRAVMSNNITHMGRERGLKMLADWTDRIAKGEVPPNPPPRPSGPERNVVLSMWGWAMMDSGFSQSVHDEIASDKRNPSVNANGPVYGTAVHFGQIAMLDPNTHTSIDVDVPGSAPEAAHNIEALPHNPMLDQKGRMWASMISHEGAVPDFCTDGAINKFAKLYPNPAKAGREVVVYDPATKKMTLIPTCFGTHHLEFAYDKDNTLYFSGDTNVMGWIDTKVWDETHDPAKSQGWCPMVLDTSGDGKVTQDRTQWNQPAEAGQTGEGATEAALDARNKGAPETAAAKGATDAAKDTRITGFLYGMGVSPKDGSIWYAKYAPQVPSGIVRLTPGANPPETCHTEYYEAPKGPDGAYAAFNARGVDLDSKGIAWVAFGSGAIGSFDRSKCKTLNGPAATGQQCPEGWKFYDSPGPKVTGVKEGSADWHYLTWVDQKNVLGLGKDVPIIPGTNSDSLLAFHPDSGKFTVLRVPYPMGFYTRGLDGRIDDPKTGWKGRGLWADYGTAQVATLHVEGAEAKLVKFQLRPDPLAH